MTGSRWVRASVATLLLSGFVPPSASAQTLPAAGSPGQTSPAPVEPVVPAAPDAVYSGGAVVATGFNIFAREVRCGVGEILGFFTLSLIRLPVWAVTLGDRIGSSEPLDRLGNSIIEKACEGPWIITTEQIRQGQPPEGRAAGEAAAMRQPQEQ